MPPLLAQRESVLGQVLVAGSAPHPKTTSDGPTSAVKAPEALSDGSATGIVFEPFEPDALAGAILDAIDLYTRAETMGGVIRAGMETDFSWQASGRKYEELYERMLEGMSE